MNRERITALLMPAAVFQSVVVGGAYGTGREVAEYVSRHGPWGGLGVLFLAALGFAGVLASSFEFARATRAHDYRHFLKALLGPGWVLYEGLFVLLLLVVLAVTGAAAGTVLGDTFDVPRGVGTLLMLVAVVLLNFAGRRLVEWTLTVGALLLTATLIALCSATFAARGEAITAAFAAGGGDPGVWRSAFVFVLYNSALAPVLLYAAAPLASRPDALLAGLLAGLAGVLPALLLHLSFMGAWPAVIAQEIPVYWLIGELHQPGLLALYVCVLCMTIIQTGVGVLQGVNERLDGWWRERRGRALSPLLHGALAGAAVILSLVLARAGIVNLVARGYGTLAWGFMCVYTLPVLVVAPCRLWRLRRSAQVAGSDGTNARSKRA